MNKHEQRIAILDEALEMATHNLLCCSENWLMTRPKPGKEKDHAEYAELVGVLDEWIKELEDAKEHCDDWSVANDKHFRHIKSFASMYLGIPYDDITVESFEQDNDGLYSAVVSFPCEDGYTTKRINEYYD